MRRLVLCLLLCCFIVPAAAQPADLTPVTLTLEPVDTGYQFVLNPDGTRVLFINYAYPPRIFDAATGELVATLADDLCDFPRWDADGLRLTCYGEPTTYRWIDSDSGAVLDETPLPDGEPSPDGTLLLMQSWTGQAVRLDVINVATSETLWTHELPANARWSQDGRFVISLEASAWQVERARFVEMLDARTGQSVFRVDDLNAAIWSPDDARVLVETGSDYALYEARGGRELWRIPHPYRDAASERGEILPPPAWSPHGEYIILWPHLHDAADGRALFPLTDTLDASFPGVGEAPHTFGWNRDGTRLLVYARWDGRVTLWDTDAGSPAFGTQPFPLDGTEGAAWSPDERYIVTWTREEAEAYVYDAVSGEKLHTLPHFAFYDAGMGSVAAPAWSGDGNTLLTYMRDVYPWWLRVGLNVTVLAAPLPIYSEPDADAAVAATLPPDAQVVVTDASVYDAATELTWWPVRTADGTEGWAPDVRIDDSGYLENLDLRTTAYIWRLGE